MINISLGNASKKAMEELGIKSYPFTSTELKNNFRALAKQHHSDKGGDDEKMKKLNDAYSTLQHLAVEDVSEEGMKESALRKREHKDKDMFAIYDPCPDCKGTGFRTRTVYDGLKECEDCNGTGSKMFHNKCRACKGSGKFKQKSGRTVDCYRCKGTGVFSSYEKSCRTCNGYGQVPNRISKREYCPNCKGTGEIELEVLNPVIRKGAVL